MLPLIPDADFIAAWLGSSSLTEVATKLDIKPIQASARATNLRKHGVKLPKFSASKQKDWTAIAELVIKTMKEPK